MKTRLTNEEVGALAANLVSGPTVVDFELLDHMDDASVQTLSTLVSQCPYCGDYTRLEDGDCTCSQSEQQFGERIYYNGDSIDLLAYRGELGELPEE